MTAVVLHERGIDGLRVEARPVPTPGPHEVLVRVMACGIGGTVLNKVNFVAEEELPRIPGHEFVGEVVEVGDAVSGPVSGDRVMAYYYVTCGRCRHCWEGSPARCLNAGRGDDRVGENRDGAYAEYVSLPARNLLPVPDGLDTIEATVAIDALATPLHVCSRAQVEPSERVAVIGAAGGVGVHLTQVLSLRGAHAFAVDRQEKLEAVGGYAPEATLLAAEDDWASSLAGSIDVVVDLIGTTATREAAFTALGRGGRLVVLTTAADQVVSVPSRRLVSGEVSILGSKYASQAELMAAADLLDRGVVRPVITARGGFDSVRTQLASIADGTLVGRGVLDLT